MRRVNLILGCAILIAHAGCLSRGPYEAKQSSRVLEDESVFVALDSGTHETVACTDVQETRGPDGELRVIAKLQNRTAQPLRIEVNCVFKDENGFATVESIPFRVVYFSPNSQEQVTFLSKNSTATRYTIRGRLPVD